MDSHHTLPFFAAPDLIPAPLPTIEAITSSQDVLKEYAGRRIVRVGAHFVVKYGAGVSLTEGENMLFAKDFSDTPIPDVYALYSTQEEGQEQTTNYIVMENIPGEPLEIRWASLDTLAKLAVSDQLRGYFTQLRKIPSPGYFGLVGKRPFDDAMFWSGDNADPRVPSGPFDSEEQMLGFMVQIYKKVNPRFTEAEFYSHFLAQVIQGHAPVFTHGDFQRWKDDWHSCVTRVLDGYLNEYA